ncbi:MAG: hypothetical protein LJE85_10915 [Gammaproteobacteria bacterium]|jgi:hypothetical protein|nr:hypothetical protein [Gammaproteobacteria bacterium]
MVKEIVTVPLRQRSTNEKILFSGFLMLVGVGYLMALTLIYFTDSKLDGNPGISVQDIADNYYGNRSGTRLEAAIRGPMAPQLKSLEERNIIVDWLKSGETRNQFQKVVQPILQKDCLQCHSPTSGLNIPDLSSYQGVMKVAQVDTGTSVATLVKLSHIHLFGIGLLLLSVGMIFRHAELHPTLKNSITVAPFIAVFVDILAWYLTKWDPVYAYTVVVAGALLGLALAIQILLPLWQMWFQPRGMKTH